MTILDGGFGTMLQAAGLAAGEDPCDWNLTHPDAVTSVHRAYVDAGAEIVTTNTFGANRLKYAGAHALSDIVPRAVELARACSPKPHRVALDIGPSGRLLAPAGDLAFEDAVAAFAETVRLGAAAGADLVLVETMGDLYELKAALVAVRDACPLPVFATVTVDADGRLLTGASVETVAAFLASLRVDAIGLNCGLGPDRMLEPLRRLAAATRLPVIAKPNAGMPQIVSGRTVFPVGPDAFAADVAKLADAGATYVGGCCGTTPDHIRAVAETCSGRAVRAVPRPAASRTVVTSGTDTVALAPHAGLVIGERINPTGKKLLKEAYAKGDTAYVLREAVKQTADGAAILDVNCGVPGLDEKALLDATVRNVQSVVTCPLQIDTADAAALEAALRHVNGKPLVNSVNGKKASMDAVFPLVRRYGGTIVALCLDEDGIPATADGRLAIARRILAEGAKYGFAKEDFVFDALTLAVAADTQAAAVTLETVRRLTDDLGVNTVLGVSNVSFSLPDRPALNDAMYALAKKAGLSAAIANPSRLRDARDPLAEDVLRGRDPNCARWIAAHATAAPVTPPASAPGAPDLRAAIVAGLREDAGAAARRRLADADPMAIVQEHIVPALEEVGSAFEKGRAFLPQLLMAADAAGEAFAAVRAALAKRRDAVGTRRGEDAASPKRPIVLATVKGDIHDIGKNIVRALLENYGFDVIDLGRDVPPERIVETARQNDAMLVGLSALMTTTVGAMAETIRQIRAANLPCRVCVGGAVVTQEYADRIGADRYAKDAMQTVRYAETLG